MLARRAAAFSLFRRHRLVDAIPKFRRKPFFEALESRLLLSADIPTLVLAEALSSALTQPAQVDTQAASPSVLNSSIQLLIVPDDGSPGTLQARNGNNVWRITGADEGTLNGEAFANVGTLIGGSDNQDTFIFEAAGKPEQPSRRRPRRL
jgi:hypothetical protein